MGWFYQQSSRAELIRDLTASPRNEGKIHLLAHCTRGNILWAVWRESVTGWAWITCDIMVRHGGLWGYKPLDESCGPCYYTCPLSYLRMAPCADEDWRRSVIAYHSRQAERRLARRAAKV